MAPRNASVLACLLALAASGAALAGNITYKYRQKDGGTLFTDRRPNASEADDYQFLGFHGRPPATAACRGMTAERMEQRAARIETPLHRIAGRFGVEQALVKAMISVESCFDPEAVSRVGARGLMQLMPSTARRLGVDNAHDVDQNLRGGIRYFSELFDRFDGDLRLALAAYNAGPAAVERYQGVPPYQETRQYVTRVLYRLHRYRSGAPPIAGD